MEELTLTTAKSNPLLCSVSACKYKNPSTSFSYSIVMEVCLHLMIPVAPKSFSMLPNVVPHQVCLAFDSSIQDLKFGSFGLFNVCLNLAYKLIQITV